MNRSILQTLLLVLLSGCRITTSVVGEGTIVSQSGLFNCTTGNVGDCVEDYLTAGSETFEAVPAPGWTFVKWTNCNYATLTTCGTAFSQNTNSDVWPITATFKPITTPVQSAAYTYNALGQRVTKTVGNVTTLFQYDTDGNLIAELNSSGQALRQHIYINGEPIAQLTRKTSGGLDVQYIHSDHLGTPTLLTNQDGRVVADLETTPFGETYIDYAEVEYNKRFPGQYKDVETGLHYNYFRDYEPTFGRYVQSDPIGLVGGLNTYGYVDGNPLSYSDPTGLTRTVFPGQNEKHVPDDDQIDPDPAFPVPSRVCFLECSTEYAKGVKKCSESCEIKMFGYNIRACQQSWSTWLTNCQINCNDYLLKRSE